MTDAEKLEVCRKILTEIRLHGGNRPPEQKEGLFGHEDDVFFHGYCCGAYEAGEAALKALEVLAVEV